VNAPGGGAPTGTVTFTNGPGGALLGSPSPTLNGAGEATFTTSTLTAATYNVVANYQGDANFVASSSRSASLKVIVQPLPTVQFNPTSYSVDDTAGPVVLTVTRIGSLLGSSAVNFATSPGSALAGSDYTTTSGSV